MQGYTLPCFQGGLSIVPNSALWPIRSLDIHQMMTYSSVPKTKEGLPGEQA